MRIPGPSLPACQQSASQLSSLEKKPCQSTQVLHMIVQILCAIMTLPYILDMAVSNVFSKKVCISGLDNAVEREDVKMHLVYVSRNKCLLTLYQHGK